MKQAIASAILGLTVLTTAGAMTAMTAVPAIAQENTMTMNILTVTGQGTERIATTRATVNLGVKVQAETAEAAQQEAARRSSAVVSLLRDRTVDKLQTTGIRLEPQYRYDNGQSQLIGYTASNTVSFEVPNEAAGALLDEAVAAGATEIQGIQFSASDEAIAAAREVALRNAVADAQAQADAVLGALNLSAEDVVSIQIGQANHPPMPLLRQAAVLAAESNASTPVVGGEQTVTASVTLQVQY
jgi:uncharacterized protein YggE